jgi:hypothetical protein
MSKLLQDIQNPSSSRWREPEQCLNSLTIQNKLWRQGHGLLSLTLKGLVLRDQLLKRHLVSCVHAISRRSHRSSVSWIALIDEVLKECSHIELLILRHLGDFPGYLGH